jgi:GNAT superfamily N-acetyltransferase
MSDIKTAVSESDLLKCFEVMCELRPTLTSENFLPTLNGFISRGYHLLFIEENNKAVCASGYRFTEHLYWGKAIYIDDLSTLPGNRGKGYAGEILKYIIEIARSNQCNEVHLDSGCGAHRYDAHRLYLKTGFNITSFHFAYKVSE